MGWADEAAQSLQNVWVGGGWQENALIAVLISFFTVSIAYMLGVAFDLPNLKRWARSEFLQAMVSSILAVGLVFALSSASVSVTGVLLSKTQAFVTVLEQPGQPLQHLPVDLKGGDPFAVAQYYLGCAGKKCVIGTTPREYGAIYCMKQMYVRLFLINLPIEMVEKSEYSVGGVYAISGWFLNVFVNAIHLLLQSLSFLFIAIYFQKALLVLIQATMLSYFLPVGIVLRTFPLTRGAGALLMGLAIGLYFFYPLTYSIILAANVGQLNTGNVLKSAACVSYDALAGNSPATPQIENSYPGLGTFSKAVFWLMDNLGKIPDWIVGVNGTIPFMVHELFLYPLVALTVTFTVTKALSDLFGADVSELARGLIKLI